MTDPQRQAPPERPDPSVLLIDAVMQRQSALAERLAQQWVHRRGWPSLESFVKGPLQSNCGPDALAWLRQRLGLDTPGGVLREALAEAIAPLRGEAERTTAAPAPAPAVAPVAKAQASDPWSLPDLETLQLDTLEREQPATNLARIPRMKPAAKPAPAPADLAGLRAWLHSEAA